MKSEENTPIWKKYSDEQPAHEQMVAKCGDYWLAMPPLPNGENYEPKRFLHKKNSKSYTVLDAEIRLKMKGEWQDAVLYSDDLEGKSYVRTKQDFEKNFNPL